MAAAHYIGFKTLVKDFLDEMESGRRKTVDNEAVKTMVLKMEDLVDNMAKETIPEAVLASHATQEETVTTTEGEKECTEPKETRSDDSTETMKKEMKTMSKTVGKIHGKETWIY